MPKKPSSFDGPGLLIAAAFIGPGTVTVCTLAGATHGLQLLWAVLLSTGMTFLFQDMSARLGIVTRLDLTSLLKKELSNPILKILVIATVLSAVVIGNGAYEAGNISGGALGLEVLLPDVGFRISPILIGLIAFGLLWSGNYSLLEKSLTLLVGLMSLAFLLTAILTRPDLSALFQGLLLPSFPEGSWLLILGVIGTTLVPYNLFLHASLARTKWPGTAQLPQARKNTLLSIAIGGLISMAIVISSASLEGQNITDALSLAGGLEPVFGTGAKYLIAIGLFAAGITSAITAPLAAAYVVAGLTQREASPQSWPFRATWMSILLLGVIFSSLGFQPIEIIRFAQVANGLLLPIAAALILWLSSSHRLLGHHRNGAIQNSIAALFLLLLVLLSLKAFGVLG
ncbi:Nramp family divalent metal transporter [Reichenbachiella ulvae]|uniref:Nramp family divalent metal transporter n=1 Tax=Reichenbachiella ulvae TaxID=2980104 RepID=A0ABT3CS87_9BACT|nr:Nramp family divalent metal transporter [Reichenbachiella ulvae]MCV9386364.1 Nramp family divalent metal transporter [Reichenbachiella ulvae]